MKKVLYQVCLLAIIVSIWSCGKDTDPQAQLPSYLRLPATLTGYAGSGLITVDGGVSLRAEGPEHLDASTNTYSGIQGEIVSGDLYAQFTVGQPRVYKESSQVPNEYKANGRLTIINTVLPGTYPMNAQAPTPRGEFADLTMNLPGPQIYISQSGSLTIDESSLVKSEGSSSLYRVRGTFQAVMYATGVGIPASQNTPTLTGTFDLLLVRN